MGMPYAVTEIVADDPAFARALELRRGYFGREGDDRDAWDAGARHFLIRDAAGTEVGTFRLIWHRGGAGLESGYTAQFFDLSAFAAETRPIAELGRFATLPGRGDPEIVRAAWACLTRIVDGEGLGLFLGVTSFRGTDPQAHAASFAALSARSVGPLRLLPAARMPGSVPLGDFGGTVPRGALAGLPPMLRAYLSMGGWVGDSVAIDPDLGNCLVFTALDIDAIPESRKRLMRAAAATD